jgi:hypothetical protein
MIREWLQGGRPKVDAPDAIEAEKGVAVVDEDERLRRERLEKGPVIAAEPTEDDKARRVQSKLRSSFTGPRGVQGVSFDSLSRATNRVLPTSDRGGYAGPEEADGVTLSCSRNIHNIMASSKWTLGKPQSAGWEMSLQMNGFSDVTAVTYSTQGRYSLMHQRMFKSGALAVTQFMYQPQMAMMGGTFFSMLQYPWGPNGATTQVQYVRGQQVQLSHAARIVRGVNAGACMTYELPTNKTSVAYAFHTTSTDKKSQWAGSWTPATGEWKLATTKFDYQSDREIGVQIEMADKRGQLVPLMSVGFVKQLIGGGQVQALLTNFRRLKAFVELPFGGQRAGFNQVKLVWGVQFDADTGGCKHGLQLSF